MAIYITYCIAKKQQKETYDYATILFIVLVAINLTISYNKKEKLEKLEKFTEYSREPYNYRPYRDNPNEKDRICKSQ